MKIELINTGAELLVGRRLNSHAQWIAQQLAQLGYPLSQQTAVDDSGPNIQRAVRQALTHADLILTTGGLGPTSDDRTRELIAELARVPLREDPQIVAHIEQIFRERLRRPAPVSTYRQAQVPEGAMVLANHHGTAPGLALELQAPDGAPRFLIMLPGPPRELCPMFKEQVIPLLLQRFPGGQFFSRVLRTTGLGESYLEEQISKPLASHTENGMELAYCARPGEVEVRLSMQGPKAHAIVVEAEAIVRSILGEVIFSDADEGLEAVVIGQLIQRRQTVAVAESCTGGLLAHRLTNVPGASSAFLGGWVTYSNLAKQSCLGVQAETLRAHGAVSEQTAREMAAGARERLGADFALSVTGIAGPSGGSEEKPVGTVYVGFATGSGATARCYLNPFDRETFKWITSQQALDRLRREIWPR